MNRYAFSIATLFLGLFFVSPVSAATSFDSVQIQLIVNNSSSTNTTSDSTTVSASTAGNGSPFGPISPNSGTTTEPLLLDGNPVIVPDQKEPESAVFRWKTTTPVSATIEWGETISYELGRKEVSIKAAQYKDNFEYVYREVAPQFEPGKRYFYRLIVKDENGRVAGYQGVYEVPFSVPRALPENVSEFRLTLLELGSEVSDGVDGGGSVERASVLLRWKNPETKDFSEVRVVCSPFGFPKDPLDGKVVYEGSGEKTIDLLESPNIRAYYYAIFAKRKDGTYSSGAVASSRALFEATAPSEQESRFSNIVNMLASIDASDLALTRYDKNGVPQTIPLSAGHISVEAGERITISAPYDLFPEILKTVIVHISRFGSSKSTLSFLLSVNTDSSAYEATFLAPSEGGGHDVEVKILDYRSDLLRNITVHDALEVQTAKTKFQNVLKNGKSQFLKAEKSLSVAILGLLAFIALAFRKIVRFF